LRQWLSENMPRIVEEALRSELDSSETTGEGTDKA
jgi:cell pole-organizing protein PopZ